MQRHQGGRLQRLRQLLTVEPHDEVIHRCYRGAEICRRCAEHRHLQTNIAQLLAKLIGERLYRGLDSATGGRQRLADQADRLLGHGDAVAGNGWH